MKIRILHECLHVCRYAGMHVRNYARTYVCMYVLNLYSHTDDSRESNTSSGRASIGPLSECVTVVVTGWIRSTLSQLTCARKS